MKQLSAKTSPLNSLFFYMIGQASWYLSQGLQIVLFPTILILMLEVSPSNYGLAQVSLLAPSIFLIVLGGTIADRTDTRVLLCFVHLLATMPLFLILLTTLSIASLFRSVTITTAPSSEKSSAVALPIPLAAPVIKTIFPLTDLEYFDKRFIFHPTYLGLLPLQRGCLSRLKRQTLIIKNQPQESPQKDY